MSPTATAIPARPRRRSGSRPTARSTASSPRSAPAARWPASRIGAQGEEAGREDRARRSAGRGALQLLHRRRAEGRRHLDHRRHRPGPHHRQSRRLYARLLLADPRRGGAADRLRPGPGGGPLPRRLDRHQHRRRDPAGARARPGPHHRDHPRRLRHALSVETVQPGIPALEEPAGAGLDGGAPAIAVPYEEVA